MQTVNLNDTKMANLNILVYGEPGSGKTHFCGTAGELLYTLFLDVDNGYKTLWKAPEAYRKNLVVVRLEDFKDVNVVYRALEKNDPAQLTKLFGVAIEKPFEAVVFDTWSQLGWRTIQYKRQQVGKLGDGLNFRENIQIQDWGGILDFHQNAIDAFTDLPITFICSMHEKMYEDDKSGIVKGVPSLNGNFAPEIGKYFDVFGHMYIDLQGKYLMATKAKNRYQGKSRLSLPETILDPTFKKIYDSVITKKEK